MYARIPIYGLGRVAMRSIRTKRKMLARLTIVRATPARLIGLRNSMRSRCRGSSWARGTCSVAMFDLGWLRLGGGCWRNGNSALFGFGLSNHRSVESVLIAIVMQRHFSVPPRPVHRIDIGVKEHLIEVPYD